MKVLILNNQVDFLGLGFARDKRLQNYYMNGNDAYRLKLWLRLERLVPRLEEKEKEKNSQNEK